MRRWPTRAAAAALALALALATPLAESRAQPRAEDPTPTAGRWTLASASRDTFTLELFWDDGTNWPTRAVAFAELRGAAPRDIAAPEVTPVTFRVERDAGDFAFDGAFYRGRGTGTFRYRPDRRFVDTLRALGVAALGDVTDHELKNLAYGDVGAAAVREFRALGFASLSKRDLLELAVRQVTPEYAGALQALGVPDASTVAGVVELRFHGVPVSYVRALAGAGVRGVPARLLVAMRRNAVTADFVRRAREEGARDLSPESLIALRRQELARAAPARSRAASVRVVFID
jgi:hypothetical protein